MSRATSGRGRATALVRELPAEPGRCWLRYAPVRWPGPATPWLDLASGGLGEGGGEPELLAALERPRLDDVLYLPPVPADLAAARDRLASRHARRGTPVLLQLLPGDALPAPVEGVVVLRDLLPDALATTGVDAHNDWSSLTGAAAALWPLAPGVGEEPAAEELAAAAVAAGVRVVVAVPLELSARARRTLADLLPEERYLRLFHGEAPAVSALARAAVRAGLQPLLPRPLPRPPLHGAGNLRIAAALAAAAELCHLAGEPESRAQALHRAARFAERAPQDLVALAREGNLALLPWLEGESLTVAAEAAPDEEPALVRELLARLAA